MFGYSSFTVIWYKVLGNSLIVIDTMHCTGDKVWHAFIWKNFRIYAVTYTNCSYENMTFDYFAGFLINNKFRFITYPINVYTFTRNAFYCHRNFFTSIVSFYKLMEMVYKLSVLITIRIIFFIIYPLIEKIGFAAFCSKSIIYQLIVRERDILSS